MRSYQILFYSIRFWFLAVSFFHAWKREHIYFHFQKESICCILWMHAWIFCGYTLAGSHLKMRFLMKVIWTKLTVKNSKNFQQHQRRYFNLHGFIMSIIWIFVFQITIYTHLQNREEKSIFSSSDLFLLKTFYFLFYFLVLPLG